MPYPLPDGGPPYTADLRWFLVAVPDDVAFVRAAMGAYTEFTKYFMWGHEGKEPGRNEAAQVWEGAIAATLEALEMGFPDILLGHIDDVETLLQSLLDKSACCPATGIEDVVTDWQDIVGDVIDTSGSDVVVGVGNPPAGAADWTQFQSKLCDGASKYADGLIAMIDNFAIIQGLLSGLTLATLGAFIASFLPILGVSVVAAGVVVTALGLLGKLDELQDLVEPVSGWDGMRTALTDAREAIICAIITSDTAAQAAARVQAVIEDIDPNIWAWIRFFTVPTTVIQRIFNMESSAAGGYGAPCSDCDDAQDSGFTFYAATAYDFDGAGSLQGLPIYFYRTYKVRGDNAGRMGLSFRDGVAPVALTVHTMQYNNGGAGDSCGQDALLKNLAGETIRTLTPATRESYTGTDEGVGSMFGACMGAWNEGTDKGFWMFWLSP